MNFLVKDLIKPNNYPKLLELDFQTKYIKPFQAMTLEDPLFDTLFYGPSGSGKFTLAMAYLQHLYGSEVLKLTPNETHDKKKKVDKSSKLDFTIEKVGAIYTSRYLTIMNDTVNDDKIVEFLKKQIDSEGSHINYVMIMHMDRLKTQTLNYVKCFIEKRRSLTCIIGTTCSLHKLGQGLKGLMAQYRVPRPSLEDQTKYFLKIVPNKFQKAKVITKGKIAKTHHETNGDLKMMVAYFNQYLLEALDSDPKLKKKHPDSYRLYLCYLLNFAIKGDPKDLNVIRSMIMVMYQSPITWPEYTKKFMSLINKSKLTDTQKIKIVEMTAEVDHQVHLSRLNYCHYEAVIFQLMEILHG